MVRPRGGQGSLLALELLLLLDERLHALLHLHDGLVLRQAQAALVGDVVDASHRLCVLAVDACTQGK